MQEFAQKQKPVRQLQSRTLRKAPTIAHVTNGPAHLQRTLGNQGVRRLFNAKPPVVAQAPASKRRGQQATPPRPAATAPKTKRTWKQIWPDYTFSLISNLAAVPALAHELVDAAEDGQDLDAVREEGMQVVEWLSRHGDPKAADRLLEVIRNTFFLAYATDVAFPQPAFGAFSATGYNLGSDPGQLIARGREAARAGKHDQAFRFFGVANEILSLYALQALEMPASTIDERYRMVQSIYDELREIYGFYYVLEREALAAGDTAKAAEARVKAAQLRVELKETYTHYEESPVELVEASLETTPGGHPGFRVFGVNKAQEVLTELPGHPWAKELIASGGGAQKQGLESLQKVIMAQTDLQAEILREPEIQKAFTARPIDLNNTSDRLKVWAIMYGVYRRSGPGALASLMALIGRYLKAYTHHTEYNIRDAGASYIGSTMPTDLAGRLESDCGVYALTVAWDVYQTARRSDAKIKLTFNLATFLDHVTLIITDVAAAEHYLVNNDEVVRIQRPVGYQPDCPPPRSGMDRQINPGPFCAPDLPPKPVDLEQEVAKQYSSLRNVPYLVTPVLYLELGSTAQPEGVLRDALWARYLEATAYMGKVPVTFGMQESFSKNAEVLDKLVQIVAVSANDSAGITKWLGDNWEFVRMLTGLFEHIVKGFKFGGKTPPPEPKKSQHTVTFRWPSGVHPLVRVALMLIRLQQLGETLSEEQKRYLKVCEVWFKDAMDEHREEAKAGRF